MIKHYLKVALRNLLKYKTHSLISVVCLAIGITCFSLMNHFVNTVSYQEDLPDYERRIHLELSSRQTDTNIGCYKEDVDYLEEQHIAGLDAIVASSSSSGRNAEITVIDKNQNEMPFLIKYQCISPTFFAYNQVRLSSGNLSLKAPDEVVISRSFAQKAFGKEDPTGMIIHLVTENKSLPNRIKDYKIVGVAFDDDTQGAWSIDCYFPLSMNPQLPLAVSSCLTGQTTLENLRQQLKEITWKRGEQDISVWASSMAEDNDIQKSIAKILVRFVASLILLSGLINFLKFIIQMFYNRQRELALRKCLGSDIKGLYSLLFAETFWMMSAAFVLSLTVTEVVISLMHTYLPPENMISFSLVKVYGLQFYLYIALLLICMLIILYPVYRLRQSSIIHNIVQKRKRHVFRHIMISLQLAIAIFFVGSVYGIMLFFGEISKNTYNPLSSEEEKQIISLSVNSIRMRQNMDAILSDIGTLSDVTDRTSVAFSFNLVNFTYMDYEKEDRSQGEVLMLQGDTHYFDFFHIPMEGKKMNSGEQGFVYVSERFKEQLQKDGVEDWVVLDGKKFQIAGTFRALNKESEQRNSIGSVFIPNPNSSIYYFRTSAPDATPDAIKKITDICRRYVPETLPLDIRAINDSKQTVMGTIGIMQKVFLLLAGISLLLVILSIYSAISMDTVSRQKEVAIRKINGATPKVIGLLFGKVYLIIYISAFCIIYPLVRLALMELTAGAGYEGIYSWDKGVLLFFVIAILMFLVTAYKIYKVMHLNPADIIKKE